MKVKKMGGAHVDMVSVQTESRRILGRAGGPKDTYSEKIMPTVKYGF